MATEKMPLKLAPGSVVLEPADVAHLRKLIADWEDPNAEGAEATFALIDLGGAIREMLGEPS